MRIKIELKINIKIILIKILSIKAKFQIKILKINSKIKQNILKAEIKLEIEIKMI